MDDRQSDHLLVSGTAIHSVHENQSIQPAVNRSPYLVPFGIKTRVGLNSTSLPVDLIDHLQMEDNLHAIVNSNGSLHTELTAPSTIPVLPADPAGLMLLLLYLNWQQVGKSVSRHFEPSQPKRITSGLKQTTICLLFTLHSSHKNHKFSETTKSVLAQIYIKHTQTSNVTFSKN